MAGMGVDEKVLLTLKIILHHHLLRLNFLYPTNRKLDKKFTPLGSLTQVQILII